MVKLSVLFHWKHGKMVKVTNSSNSFDAISTQVLNDNNITNAVRVTWCKLVSSNCWKAFLTKSWKSGMAHGRKSAWLELGIFGKLVKTDRS